MVLTASALGMKHLMSKTKQLLQEPAKDLEFDTGETEQKALIETSDIVTMFARLAKVYGSYSYSRPSGVEMCKMVSVVVLRIKQLEAVVKNLDKRDDKKDAFKRAILAKAGGISRGDICASTTCLVSSEQYSGLVIHNSSSWKTGEGVQIWSQTALRTLRTRPPLEPLRSCQICTIPVSCYNVRRLPCLARFATAGFVNSLARNASVLV